MGTPAPTDRMALPGVGSRAESLWHHSSDAVSDGPEVLFISDMVTDSQ